MERVFHIIDPIFDQNSQILILGSFPSVKSRKVQFYYGHPQNRFWKVMERLYHVSLESVEDKKKFLHEKHIALWDVIESCIITGSSDASISQIRCNHVKKLIDQTSIHKVFVNGKKAKLYYDRYLQDECQLEGIYLPSTSPANAAYSLERLIEEWKQITG